jgi:hypothetical protein
MEKVLSMLDLSNNSEIEYATMVITRDYARLQTLNRRTTTTLVQNQESLINENNLPTTTSENITNNIFLIPTNL